MKVEVGSHIRIVDMYNEPGYSWKEGVVEFIDDEGQLHGTWGGCAIIPKVDTFEVDGQTICPICGNTMKNKNNAYPFKRGCVCDACNLSYVLPLRLFLSGKVKNQAMLISPNGTISFEKSERDEMPLKKLQEMVGGSIEIYPKKDSHFLFLVDEDGIIKRKKLNKLAFELFDIRVVGNLLVLPQNLMK